VISPVGRNDKLYGQYVTEISNFYKKAKCFLLAPTEVKILLYWSR